MVCGHVSWVGWVGVQEDRGRGDGVAEAEAVGRDPGVVMAVAVAVVVVVWVGVVALGVVWVWVRVWVGLVFDFDGAVLVEVVDIAELNRLFVLDRFGVWVRTRELGLGHVVANVYCRVVRSWEEQGQIDAHLPASVT